MKPRLAEIKFNDGTRISLDSGSVLAVVGANNSGKTHFLRTLISQLHGAPFGEVPPTGGLIESVRLSWPENNDGIENLRGRAMSIYFNMGDGRLQVNNGVSYTKGAGFHIDKISELLYKPSTFGILADLFVQFDDAVQRVEETEVKRLHPPGGHDKQSLTQRARESIEATREIKRYFFEIFNREISYYDRGTGTIGFILAPELDSASITGGALTNETKSYMEESSKVWLQGLGMRSVLGLLLRVFAQDQPILVVDEPEAFLHPPQASLLGAVLREIADDRGIQIILATHSRHILQGLTRVVSPKVHIEKLDNVNETRRRVGLSPENLSSARTRSLVRFSPILDSLFSKMTILVENETDALFYSEAVEAYIRSGGTGSTGFTSDDLLFFGVGGKSALGRTANLVRALKSEVRIIVDFDVLNCRETVESIVDGIGAKDDSGILALYERFRDSVESYGKTNGYNTAQSFKKLKNTGLNIYDNTISATAKELLEYLYSIGVVVCHVGELEDFAPELKAQYGKEEWPMRAIQEGVHEKADAQIIPHQIFQSVTQDRSNSG